MVIRMKNFTIRYDMAVRGLSTLFKYKLFTVDAKVHKNWDHDQLESYLGEYELKVSSTVLGACAADVRNLLDEMGKEDPPSKLTLKKNKGERYQESGATQYIKCEVPMNVLVYLKKIFVSTIVYEAASQSIPTSIPDPEYIELEFDTEARTVTVVDLHTYEPQGNPYHKYARNAVAPLSVEAIGIDVYGADEEGKVKDFYDIKKMSKWKEAADFFKRDDTTGKIEPLADKEVVLENRPGIYMLYDENRNALYVGKAKNLRKRILEHAINAQGTDPIPGFTHYRYSVVSDEYFEFLYLIENAAIHDLAWILDMPSAQQYRPALCKKTEKILNECQIVNTVERQRKKGDR